MTKPINSYNDWLTVVFMIAFTSLFVFSFFPLKKKNWQTLGITQAFIVALYTEMYGFPLTIYFLTSVFGVNIPLLHIKGHLWSTLFGWGEKGALIEMFIGQLITILGIILIIAGWRKIYRTKTKNLSTNGIYALVRHPQYTGIILTAFGAFIHWPTLPTLLMLPILIVAYYNLAKKEEKEMKVKFGKVYLNYKKITPMFLPAVRGIK